MSAEIEQSQRNENHYPIINWPTTNTYVNAGLYAGIGFSVGAIAVVAGATALKTAGQYMLTIGSNMTSVFRKSPEQLNAKIPGPTDITKLTWSISSLADAIRCRGIEEDCLTY